MGEEETAMDIKAFHTDLHSKFNINPNNKISVCIFSVKGHEVKRQVPYYDNEDNSHDIYVLLQFVLSVLVVKWGFTKESDVSVRISQDFSGHASDACHAMLRKQASKGRLFFPTRNNAYIEPDHSTALHR